MHRTCRIAALLGTIGLTSSPVIASDCPYPEGYICHDNLVFRGTKRGPWHAFDKGDGRAPYDYAAKACANGNFEGKPGWRLPTENELLAFVKSSVRPSVESSHWRVNGGSTWTSTPGEKGYFRYVSLRLDMVDAGQFPGFEPRNVSCVREK